MPAKQVRYIIEADPEAAAEHVKKADAAYYSRAEHQLIVIRSIGPNETTTPEEDLRRMDLAATWEASADKVESFKDIPTTGDFKADLFLAFNKVTESGMYPCHVLVNPSINLPAKVLGVGVSTWEREGIGVLGSILPFEIEGDADICVWIKTSENLTVSDLLFS